jgi:hypothetical protein
MSTHPKFINPTRHWLLVHDGASHSLEWDDGERLLAVVSAARAGGPDPHSFTFTPRGSDDDSSVTILVDSHRSWELLTQYDAEESHWFG